MSYKLFYTDRVKSNFEEHLLYLAGECVSGQVIGRWYARLLDAIDELAEMPRLYAVDEFYSQLVGFEVRKLTYKKYIVRYRIDEDEKVVYLLSFMHGARRPEA